MYSNTGSSNKEGFVILYFQSFWEKLFLELIFPNSYS